LPFLQANLVEEDGRASGAEIRNDGNFQVLSELLDGTRLYLRKNRGGDRRSSPTVARLDPDDVTRLVDVARSTGPEFILFEGVALLDAMRTVRQALPDMPIVCDFHNVEARLYRDVRLARLPRPARPVARLLLRHRFREAAEADREAGRIAGSIWTCSERDAAAVRGMVEARAVHVVPNPIPAWCRTVDADMERGPGRSVLFVGHLGYAPNRRAVDELVGSIMPELQRRFADAELHVGGRAPRERLARLLRDHGHRLTADPPDMAPLYRDAAAAVMPLRQGGGTRIKALEALAVGCPVVATAKAVEGLCLEDGRHFLRAETTSDFVSALSRLFQDRELGRRLAAEGRLFVKETHGDAARSEAVRRALAGIGDA
jgi:glycosyltransferase involved in cell wall biosynthesis